MSSSQSDTRRRWEAIGSAEAGLIALQVLFILFTRVWQRPIYTDDAYIHFRNIQNWVAGRGLVFNGGEWVLGTTSLVYSTLLGFIHMITGAALPALATWGGAAADVGIVVFTLLWLTRAGVPLLWRHGIVLVLSAEPQRMIYSATGMEMSLFILAWLAALECLYRNRWLGAGLILGALGWIRPEGAIVWVSVALALGFTRRASELWKTGACAIAVALLFCIALTFTYGSFLPQSIHVKSQASWFHTLSGWCHVNFFINLGNLTPFQPLNNFQASWGSVGDKINSSLVASAQIGLMAIGAHYLWRRGITFLAVFLASYMIGYYLFYAIPNPQYFDWYYVPYYFGSILLAGLGWWSLASAALDWLKRRHAGRRWIQPVFYGTATTALFLCSMLAASAASLPYRFRAETNWQGLAFRFKPTTEQDREALYVKAAERLTDWVGGDDSIRVGLIEIGIFGYYFPGRIFDVFGLVSPEALDALKPEVAETIDESCRDHPLNVLMALRPEYAVVAPVWRMATPPAFLEVYEEIVCPDIRLRFFARRDIDHAERMKLREANVRAAGAGR